MRPILALIIHLVSLIGLIVGASALGGGSVWIGALGLSESSNTVVQAALLVTCPYVFAYSFHVLLESRKQTLR